MINGKPGGGVDLLDRPSRDPGEAAPPRTQARRHAPVRTAPQEGHGVAPVRCNRTDGTVPGAIRGEHDDLRGAAIGAPAAASGSAELDEDRPGGAREKM